MTLFDARLVVGPMVDQSELPFRMLCRSYGAEMCFTPMLHAALFVKDIRYRRENFTTCPQDRPLIVQFCANDPVTFAAAAKLVEGECDGVDLNLGCPQGIAKKGHYGAFLMDELELIIRMVGAAAKAVSIPISCKIRIFPDPEKTVNYAKALVDAGARMLTVHGRTREMKGVMTGLADWKQIRAVREAVNVPVYANGNIQFMENVDKCIAETGADGVVVAEAILHSPAFFSGCHVPCWHLCRQYLDLFHQYPTHPANVRAHLFKMLHHVLQLPENFCLREALTKSKTIADFSEIVERVRILYEHESEDQVLEMTTLPVPVYVSQPHFRIDRTLGVGNPAMDSKRPLVSADETGVRAEKKRKGQSGKEDRQKNFELCVSCKNPRGLSCRWQSCRSCCLTIVSQEGSDVCPNHRTVRKKETATTKAS